MAVKFSISVEFDTLRFSITEIGLEILVVDILEALRFIWLHEEDPSIVLVNCWHGALTGCKEMRLGKVSLRCIY